MPEPTPEHQATAERIVKEFSDRCAYDPEQCPGLIHAIAAALAQEAQRVEDAGQKEFCVICEVCADQDVVDPERAPQWLRGLLEIRPSCLPCAVEYAEGWAQG